MRNKDSFKRFDKKCTRATNEYFVRFEAFFAGVVKTRFAKEKFLTTYFDERVRTCFPYHFVSRGWFSMRTIFYRVKCYDSRIVTKNMVELIAVLCKIRVNTSKLLR